LQHAPFSPSNRLDSIPHLKVSFSAQDVFNRKVYIPDKFDADFVPGLVCGS
jgi:hypothetical protein